MIILDEAARAIQPIEEEANDSSICSMYDR